MNNGVCFHPSIEKVMLRRANALSLTASSQLQVLTQTPAAAITNGLNQHAQLNMARGEIKCFIHQAGFANRPWVRYRGLSVSRNRFNTTPSKRWWLFYHRKRCECSNSPWQQRNKSSYLATASGLNISWPPPCRTRSPLRPAAVQIHHIGSGLIRPK
jgi:hypothetical protein